MFLLRGSLWGPCGVFWWFWGSLWDPKIHKKCHKSWTQNVSSELTQKSDSFGSPEPLKTVLPLQWGSNSRFFQGSLKLIKNGPNMDPNWDPVCSKTGFKRASKKQTKKHTEHRPKYDHPGTPRGTPNPSKWTLEGDSGAAEIHFGAPGGPRDHF